MGTASRKTWLEKQSDDVQIFVLSMDDSGQTLEQMVAALKAKEGVAVKRSTLAASIKAFRALYGKDLALARLYERRADEITAQYPGLEPKKLVRRALLRELQSKEFQTARMSAEGTIAASQAEWALMLKERHTAAMEAQVEEKRRENDLLEKKIAAGSFADGGLAAREIYLTAAQDVLKKLRTYAELKAGLDRRQAEIVNELAGSAENFARQLEREA